MTRLETIIYCAGLLDGEGSFGITMRQRKHFASEAHITCQMMDKQSIVLLHETFGGNIHAYEYPQYKTKMLYHWRISGKQAAEAAKELLPYLQIKREQAKNIIAYAKILRPRNIGPQAKLTLAEETLRRSFCEKARALNARGLTQ
jgi:hypothetical protein